MGFEAGQLALAFTAEDAEESPGSNNKRGGDDPIHESLFIIGILCVAVE